MRVKVSVLMPVYNVGQFIKAAIESILTQTYKDFEFIIIDDASTDNTLEIIQKFQDSRIKVVTNKVNKGLAANLNEGIKIAVGEYILRMDGDDISLPERIDFQIKFMDNNPEVGISGTWIRLFGSVSTVNKYPVADQACRSRLMFDVPFAHPSVILRRSVFLSNNLFYDETLKQYGEDYDLWIRASKVTKFANIPFVLLRYRTFEFNYKQKSENLRAEKGKELRERILSEIGFLLSKKDKECLQIFARREPILDRNVSIRDVQTFVIKLEKHIEKRNNLDNAEFKEIVGLFWFLLCYNQNRFSAIKPYFLSPLKGYYTPSIFLQVKFLFRQIVPIKLKVG